MPGSNGRWGWHELDERWAAPLVSAADVRPRDLVLDVGAGSGVVTAALLAAGARVVAVELHPQRAALLRERFCGQRVTVVQADATDLRLPKRPFKVVANPPFGATTALLRRLTSPASRLDRASLVLPDWAVARWAAGRGAGRPSSRFTCAPGPGVPRRAFRPPPPGTTRLLLISRVA